MKSVETIKEFCEYEHSHYIVRLTPYEFYLLKKSVAKHITIKEIEMEQFEWERTPENYEKLFELQNLYDDLKHVPF